MCLIYKWCKFISIPESFVDSYSHCQHYYSRKWKGWNKRASSALFYFPIRVSISISIVFTYELISLLTCRCFCWRHYSPDGHLVPVLLWGGGDWFQSHCLWLASGDANQNMWNSPMLSSTVIITGAIPFRYLCIINPICTSFCLPLLAKFSLGYRSPVNYTFFQILLFISMDTSIGK